MTQSGEAIAPHGGALTIREAEESRKAELQEKARSLPKLSLHDFELSDVDMFACGALSPLEGFQNAADFRAVLADARLADGLPWGVPIVLARDREQLACEKISEGAEIALTDANGEPTALMEIRELAAHDKQAHARQVFGTTEAAHPGVARVKNLMGDTLLSGPVSVFRRPPVDCPAAYRRDPQETRRLFAEKGWRTVVAFQTRNPIHRAHEYLTKVALECVDALLIHPLVGETKSDDIPARVRMECYRVLLDNYYPKTRVLLSAFPAAMRYGGPREAVHHAVCRKNYGCTHFIIGRDHAGVNRPDGSSYYGSYDAQTFFARYRPEELGIQLFKFENTFFDRRSGGMCSLKTAPEGNEPVSVSGTKMRDMLKNGLVPPPEVTRPEVAQILIEHMRNPQN